MTNKTDWIVHYVSNNVCCDECGKREDSFLPCLCNAHTHGMKKYNHLDFQLVLDLGAQEVCRILNELGRRVRAGHRFTEGELVSGIYEDCAVRLDNSIRCGVVLNVRCLFLRTYMRSNNITGRCPQSCMNVCIPACSRYPVPERCTGYSIPNFRKGIAAGQCPYPISLNLNTSTGGKHFTIAVVSGSMVIKFRVTGGLIWGGPEKE